MILRWLVTNLVRNAAHEQLRSVVVNGVSRDRTTHEMGTDEPLPPIDTAVVFALGVESGGLVDLLQECTTTRCYSHTEHRGQLNGRHVLIVESGVGIEAAGSVAADVIELHRPNWVISAGFAGSLHDELRRGHFLLAEEVVDAKGQRLSVGLSVDRASIAASPSLHVGRLLTVDQLIRTRAMKEQLGTQHSGAGLRHGNTRGRPSLSAQSC